MMTATTEMPAQQTPALMTARASIRLFAILTVVMVNATQAKPVALAPLIAEPATIVVAEAVEEVIQALAWNGIAENGLLHALMANKLRAALKNTGLL
jgi:hypothetical protein